MGPDVLTINDRTSYSGFTAQNSGPCTLAVSVGPSPHPRLLIPLFLWALLTRALYTQSPFVPQSYAPAVTLGLIKMNTTGLL